MTPENYIASYWNNTDRRYEFAMWGADVPTDGKYERQFIKGENWTPCNVFSNISDARLYLVRERKFDLANVNALWREANVKEIVARAADVREHADYLDWKNSAGNWGPVNGWAAKEWHDDFPVRVRVKQG